MALTTCSSDDDFIKVKRSSVDCLQRSLVECFKSLEVVLAQATSLQEEQHMHVSEFLDSKRAPQAEPPTLLHLACIERSKTVAFFSSSPQAERHHVHDEPKSEIASQAKPPAAHDACIEPPGNDQVSLSNKRLDTYASFGDLAVHTDEDPAGIRKTLDSSVTRTSTAQGFAAVASASRVFRIHKNWNVQPVGVKQRSVVPIAPSAFEGEGTSIATALFGDEDEQADAPEERNRYSKFVLHPESRLRTLWDVSGCLFVGYDLLYLPMQLLNPPASTLVFFMAWCSRIYWTTDIVFSFTSGFIKRSGQIQLVPSKIIRRYLTTWFALDVSIVLSDWLDLMFPDDNFDAETARVGKATRILRIMRLLRLLRIFRIADSFCIVQERLNFSSESFKLVSEICKTLSAVLILAHFIACTWFGIADVCKASNMSHWFEDNPSLHHDFFLRYITSLHWALAQFQGGMDEFVPHNVYERVFIVFIALLTFAVSTGFISRLTSLMTQLYILTKRDAHQFSLLRNYLRQNGISSKLASRINRSVKFNLDASKARVQERAVELLSLASSGLRAELDFERYTLIYSQHRFFRCYIEECPLVMRRICHEGSRINWMSDGEMLFSGGENPERPKMYVLTEGKLTYIGLNGRIAVIAKVAGEIASDRCFICEHAVWTTWVHMGLLKSAEYTTICELEVKKLHAAATRFYTADFDPRSYATEYVRFLNSRGDELSDLAMKLTIDEETELTSAIRPRPKMNNRAHVRSIAR